ncbi:MAG: prolipoprotein diacylglyceryl transferase [Thermomicrobiales bacterium]|nr:prolipoprotein diacylglyceryl transferase [Thermomicrobiales bacterium]
MITSPASPIAFDLLGLDVRWYALFLLAGMVAGLLLTRTLAERVGLDPAWVWEAAPWVVLAAIAGARLYYVLLRAGYFTQHPAEAINLRMGGMAFHGSLVAGIAAFVYLCRRDHQPVWAWTDVAVPGVGLAQAIGRWGNWANQEAFGLPSTLPWAVSIDPAHRPPQYADHTTFHPTFLYESVFNLANAVLLSWVALRIPRSPHLRHGDTLGVYLVTYGVARFLIERLRTDSLFIGPLPAAYWLSWALIAAGVFVLAAPRVRGSRDDSGPASAPAD